MVLPTQSAGNLRGIAPHPVLKLRNDDNGCGSVTPSTPLQSSAHIGFQFSSGTVFLPATVMIKENQGMPGAAKIQPEDLWRMTEAAGVVLGMHEDDETRRTDVQTAPP
ncbi:MAG TPA: hypothetical protein PKK06_09290 [Phycisphaerae bacterium]|nr:hypothetical protein [Phycisphaerae bacterium]